MVTELFHSMTKWSMRGQLDRGDVFLSFDPLSQSCQLFPREFRAALQSLDEEENY